MNRVTNLSIKETCTCKGIITGSFPSPCPVVRVQCRHGSSVSILAPFREIVSGHVQWLIGKEEERREGERQGGRQGRREVREGG